MSDRALVLSGGGRNGAFQLGVLHKLIELKKRDYAVFFGTSVGAINATRLAMAPAGYGELREAYRDLKKLWFERIKGNRSIYKKHFLWGTPFGRSWFSTKPLRKLVASLLDAKALKETSRKLHIGAVSYHTGRYLEWSGHSPYILQAIMASSAFPMAFPMENIEGELWMDAGVRNPAPLRSALFMSNISHIDVVLTAPEGLPEIPKAKKRPTWMQYGLRTLRIMNHEIRQDDLDNCAKKGVTVVVWRPREDLGDPLDFSPKEIKRLYEMGLNALPRRLTRPGHVIN